MKSKEYWKKRAENISDYQFKKADNYKVQLEAQYKEALVSIQDEIKLFYRKFAKNNEISLIEARKKLNSNELHEFKMSLEEFIKKARNNKNSKWEKELNNVSYKVRVTRLQALQTQIMSTIESLYDKENKGTTELLKDIYKDAYYRNIYEIHKGLGIGVNFAKLDTKTIDKILNEPWHGDNYSSRIWKNKEILIKELKSNLIKGFTLGSSIDKTSKIISNRMKVGISRTRRLVNTESAYITSKATLDGYEKSGVVKKYEILATLDLHTSKICRSMDGKVFKISEKKIGINAPPFHPNCRTTTVPYFNDVIDEERIARDSKGKNYYIDENMNYKQWHDKYFRKKDMINKNNLTWNRFKISNKEFTNKKEISKYLRNEYDIKFSDSRKYPIHKDLLQDSINWLDKFHSYFKGFKEIDPVELPAIKVKAGVNAVGYYSYYLNKPEAIELVLNGLYFTDKNSNIEYIEHCIKSRWTVANAKGHKTFVHEYGHHVANSLKWLDKEDNKISQDWCKHFIDSVIGEYNRIYNKNIEFKDISTLVSRYGGTKPAEAFAETFAEAFGGDNPRKFAQVFRNKVEEKLNYHIKRKKGYNGSSRT